MPDETRPGRIRTFESDAALYSSRPKALGKSLREQITKRPEEPEEKTSKKRWILISGILTLLLLSGGTVFFYYFGGFDKKAGNIFSEKPEQLISAEEEIINLSKSENFETELQKSLLRQPSSGNFKTVIFSEKRGEGIYFFSPEEFLTLSGLSPPTNLRSNIKAYNLGAWKEAGALYPFLVFKVSSFENSFAGALFWEKEMSKELQIFFPELKTVDEFKINFSDRIIKNQDVRVLEENGIPKLFYTFFNKNLFIITSSQKTLEAILERYEIFGAK